MLRWVILVPQSNYKPACDYPVAETAASEYNQVYPLEETYETHRKNQISYHQRQKIQLCTQKAKRR